ncbi:DKNYY domain-containing protein [Wohlfahrtiimonas populi]|uniref:DKNYY domain-containing protein n=1 Tax=Wohlfahrtiimonas populi TaxID=1940240 RepID=UPI00098D7143|nr:DKNYY domain-containing protein [Wohlfahrtiimonas populi]
MIKNLILSAMLLGFFGITTSAETIEYKHYKITDEGVFYLSGKDEPLLLPYANPKTFVVLDDEVAKDDQSVYVKNNRIFGINSNSFTKLYYQYFKDNQYTYRLLLKTFSIITNIENDYELYPYDRYWRINNTAYLSSYSIQNIDSPSFSLIDQFYAKDKYHIYYDAVPIEGIDVKSFQLINSTAKLSKDKNSVFYDTKKIMDADVNSFEHILGYYAKDKNHIYFGDKKIENADLNSFEVFQDNTTKTYLLNEYIAKDTNSVFIARDVIPNADPATFHLLGAGYTKDKNNIYRGKNIVDGADLESFEVLYGGKNHKTSFYAKDKNNIYYSNKPIQVANTAHPIDIKTFGLLNDKLNKIAKDKNAVYQIANDSLFPLIDADSKSFQFINDEYAKDERNIYQIDFWTGLIKTYVHPSDIDTFAILNENYSIDKNIAYWNGREVKKSDPKTFKTLTPTYSFDHKNIYFEAFNINNANPKTFKILNDNFITQDDKYVFYKEQIIKGADAQSFIAFNNHFGKDSKNIYAFFNYYKPTEILKKADPKTFEAIKQFTSKNIQYAKDKKYVFYHNGNKADIIKGADPKTFNVTELGIGQDKNGCYEAEKKVDCK